MKEIGRLLKEKREENGVLLLEAAEDLEIDENALENMEEGNIRAFKDMYVLKELIKDYAKYLGLDVNDIVEEFNDFLFEHTSKISLSDIEMVKKNQEDTTKKVISPYTKIPKQKRDYSKFLKIIVFILGFILLLVILSFLFRKDDNRSVELRNKFKEVYYELA